MPASERRTEVLQLRLTKGERETLDEGAAEAGEVVSEFIRGAALDRAEALVEKKSGPRKR